MKNIQLTVAQPCHQDWNGMDRMQKGRFCGACQKQVIDFSAMTDSQLAAFFKKPAGSICGRFHTCQLQKNIALPKKQLPFIKYVFAAAIPAFLLSLKAGAQKALNPKPAQSQNVPVVGKVSVAPAREEANHIEVIAGTVTDGAGKGISYATVMAAGMSTGTTCDSSGRFILTSKKQKIDSINVSCIGYESKDYAVVKDKDMHIVLEERSMAFTMGVLVVNTVKNKLQKPVPLLTKKSDINAALHFSVYPNPVSRNAAFRINTSKLEGGTYRLNLFNNAGEVFCNKEIMIDKKSSTIEVNTGNATPGAAFVQLTQTKTGRQATEKTIVQ